MFQARRRRGSLSRACVLLPSAAVDDAHHDDMVFNIIKKLPCKFFFFYFYIIWFHITPVALVLSLQMHKTRKSHVTYLLWRTVGPGVITERTYASLTPNREKQMQVLKHTTRSHKQGKQYAASHSKMHGFFT